MISKSNIRVLSICDHETIRQSRELVLKQGGFDVQSATSTTCLSDEQIRSFQVAILCHSLEDAVARKIAARLRRVNSSIRLVRIRGEVGDSSFGYDFDCGMLPGPVALLEAVRMLSSSDSLHKQQTG